MQGDIFKIQTPIMGDMSMALAYNPDNSQRLLIPMGIVGTIKKSFGIGADENRFFVVAAVTKKGVIHVSKKATEADFDALVG